jgi:hypothetical protein
VDKDQMETLIVADSIRKARRFMRTGKEDRDV